MLQIDAPVVENFWLRHGYATCPIVADILHISKYLGICSWR